MAESPNVGKSKLAELLGWTRARLDRRLESDANFPVAARGTQAGGWKFNPTEVMKYLAGAPVRRKAPPEFQAQTALQAPGALDDNEPGASHTGEATARQRRDGAQAALLEDKLRRERGELLEVEEVRLVLGTMLAHLGKGLDGLPDLIVKQLGVPEEDADQIRTMIDDLRRNIVTDLRAVLATQETPREAA